MNRRTSLMAMFAVMGQAFAQSKISSSQMVFSTPLKMEDLMVSLGEGGFKRFHFTNGTETVTFTAEELFTALKQNAS